MKCLQPLAADISDTGKFVEKSSYKYGKREIEREKEGCFFLPGFYFATNTQRKSGPEKERNHGYYTLRLRRQE
jgi:hypothetical protein